MTLTYIFKHSDLNLVARDDNLTKRVRHSMAVPCYSVAAVTDTALATFYTLGNLLTAGTFSSLKHKTSEVCEIARGSLAVVFVRALSIINPNMRLSSKWINFNNANGFIHAHTTLKLFNLRKEALESNPFSRHVTSRAIALICLAVSPLTRFADLSIAFPAMLASLITRGKKPVTVILAARALHLPGIVQDINDFGTAFLNHKI